MIHRWSLVSGALWALPFTVTSKIVSKDGMGSGSLMMCSLAFREEEARGVVGALCFDVEAVPFPRAVCQRDHRSMRATAKQVAEEFEQIFCVMKPDFDKYFADGLPRPGSYTEFLAELQRPGGVFWMPGQMAALLSPAAPKRSDRP